MGRSARFFVAVWLVALGCGDDATPGLDAGADSGDDADTRTCANAGECDDGLFCNGAETCAAGSCAAGSPRCAAPLACDEAADACIGDCGPRDADGDGAESIACGGDDCDDADPNRYPGRAEICDADAADEDCNAATFGDRDADGDGAVDARCCNGAVCGTDCDDLRPSVGPAGAEVCDAIDNDCDSMIDETVLVSGFADRDGDLHGDPAMPIEACPGRPGFSALGDDCNDADVAVHGAQIEICDGRDNDCDMAIDEDVAAVAWYRDADGDGFGSAAGGVVTSCTPVAGHSLLGSDCDDGTRTVNPAAAELCNGRDDDCNGRADAPVAGGGFEDDDGDGFIDARCGIGDDCDDDDPSIAPGAVEACDGRDNDCDGVSDDMTSDTTWWPDLDRDGYGDPSGTTRTSCEQPRGYAIRAGDCDDGNALVNPAAPDADCDGDDEDCDLETDEGGARLAWYADVDADGFFGGAPVLFCADPGPVYGASARDCDDADRAINPLALESCDAVDEDCDFAVDEGLGGLMACGMGACRRTAVLCDMGMPRMCVPGTPATESCDGTMGDEDCDGRVDEEPDASAACSSATTIGACSSGSCAIAGCVGSNADCNGIVADGCEADLATSSLHCGVCEHRCLASGCADGACVNEPIDVDAGEFHTCVVLGSGRVFCWGRNDVGQLGDGTTIARSSAVEVTGITDAVQVSLGLDHSCARRRDGTVSCWGSNDSRQLGTNVGVSSSTPIARSGGGLVAEVLELDAGFEHTCVRTTSGRLLCFGSSSDGKLGAGCGSVVCHNALFVLAVDAASMLAVGGEHSVAERATPTTNLATWGRNVNGAIVRAGASTPAADAMPALSDAIDIGAGTDYTCALRAGGQVVCGGGDAWGQLGDGMPLASVSTLDALTSVTDAEALFTGFEHVCVRRAAGAFSCWGRNDAGQLGAATAGTMQPDPAPVTILPSPARVFALGYRHTCAILGSQRVVCWGDNSQGQLGDGTSMPRTDARVVTGLPLP